MPAATGKGFPYVQPADAVADYPTTSQALAQKIDDKVPYAVAAGMVTVTIAAAATQGTAAVTFPVGRFTVAPIVQASVNNAGSSDQYAPRMSPVPTASGFSVVMNRQTAGAASYAIGWTAVQMGTGAAAG
jgi:hypothetical protein